EQRHGAAFESQRNLERRALRRPHDGGLLPAHRRVPRLFAFRRARPTRGAGELDKAAARLPQHAQDPAPNLLAVGVEVEQDACRDALVLAQQPEQDVLGADVVVAEAQRLAQRQLEHPLGARRERDLARGDLLARPDEPHDLAAHTLDRDLEALEHAGRETLLFTQQPEQDVLGADVAVLERSRLLLRENDHLPGPLCESLEHPSSVARRHGARTILAWLGEPYPALMS